MFTYVARVQYPISRGITRLRGGAAKESCHSKSKVICLCPGDLITRPPSIPAGQVIFSALQKDLTCLKVYNTS